MKDQDYLKISQTVFIDFFQLRIVKCLLYIIISCFSALSSFEFASLLFKFELDYFIQYSPSCFMSLYMLTTYMSLPMTSDVLQESIEGLKSCRLESKHNTVLKQNKKEITAAISYVVAGLSAATLTGTLFTIPAKNDTDLFLMLRLFEDFFPKWWKNILSWVFRVSLVPLICLSTVSPSHFMVHGFLHFKVQENILLHHVANINKGYEKCEHLDQKTQDIVKKRLILCLKDHTNFSRILRQSLRRHEMFVFPFKIMGAVAMISIVVYTFAAPSALPNLYYWRIFWLTVLSLIQLGGFCAYGQKVEDMSDNVFNALVGVKWYHWNAENKKLYLMFLINAGKPFKLKFSDDISVNHKMGVEQLKIFFSYVSVARQIRMRKSY